MTTLIKTSASTMDRQEIVRASTVVLNGVTKSAAEILAERLAIRTVFDLASSQLFHGALALCSLNNDGELYAAHGLVPADLLDSGYPTSNDPVTWPQMPIDALRGLSNTMAKALSRELGIETLRDMASWPPFVNALELVGYSTTAPEAFVDPEVPNELVPKFNEHATDKSFYSVYTIDAPRDGGSLSNLDGPVDLARLASMPVRAVPRTGYLLRYEQAWIPTALTLGNLLHSLALAPGESTRIAMIDWSRKQGVRTTEDIAQLESLTNTMMQARTIGEVASAVAREAQQGFSTSQANSTVTNTASSSFGLTNPEQAMAAAAVGALGGAAAGGTLGTIVGAGVGGVAGLAVGSVVPAIGNAAGGVLGLGLGGLAGSAAFGLVGATTGGVGMGLLASNYGAEAGSGSDVIVDSVTTTSSIGDREIEASMLQSIQDRTQQHSTTARNRRASVVQEVSESESEQITTRVVTNYNHMHALTMQYFEVVQLYAVRTTLVEKQPVLYIPIATLRRWSPELVNLLRRELIRAALTADIAYSLATTAGTLNLRSPTFAAVPAEQFRTLDDSDLRHARSVLGTLVSANPYDGWTVPDRVSLSAVYGASPGDGGPWGAVDSRQVLDRKLYAVKKDGTREEINPMESSALDLADVARFDFELGVRAGASWTFRENLTDDRYASMRFHLVVDDEAILFTAHYMYGPGNIIDDGKRLVIPVLMLDRALPLASVIDHLDANSHHYTRAVLRNANNVLIRRMLESMQYEGSPLLSLVDPTPVAIAGDDLVFLLHKEPANNRARETTGRLPQRIERSISSASAKVGEITSTEIVPIATGGVFAEAVQGRANAAEVLDITRFWNWEDSPIPITPPDLAPIQAGSRSRSPNVLPGQLSSPVIGIQSPAELPAPSSIAAALNAVSREIFRDMSGVAQTAAAAKSALEQAMAGATETGADASGNLANGLALTGQVAEELIEMNSKFAEKIVDAGLAAVGMLGGTGGAGGSGTLGAVARQVAQGVGGAVSPSTGGAVVGHATKRDAARSRSNSPPRSPGAEAPDDLVEYDRPTSSSNGGRTSRSGDGGYLDRAMDWIMNLPSDVGGPIADTARETIGNFGSTLSDLPEHLRGLWPFDGDGEDADAATAPVYQPWRPELDPSLYTGPGMASSAPAPETVIELMARNSLRRVLLKHQESSSGLPAWEQVHGQFEVWFDSGVKPLMIYAKSNDAYLNAALRQWVTWKEFMQSFGHGEHIYEVEDVDMEVLAALGLKAAIEKAGERMKEQNDLRYLEDLVRWSERSATLGIADHHPDLRLVSVLDDSPIHVRLSGVSLDQSLVVGAHDVLQIRGGLAIGENNPLADRIVEIAITATNASTSPESGSIYPAGHLEVDVERTGAGAVVVKVSGTCTLSQIPSHTFSTVREAVIPVI